MTVMTVYTKNETHIQGPHEEFFQLLSGFVRMANVFEHVVGVLSGDLEHDFRTTGMIIEVRRHIIHHRPPIVHVPDDQIAILLIVMLLHLRIASQRWGVGRTSSNVRPFSSVIVVDDVCSGELVPVRGSGIVSTTRCSQN